MPERMQKTTIMIPEGLYERIKRMAAERGESMGQLVRESLEETVKKKHPRPRSIGIFDSGYTDTAEKAGEIKFEPRTWRS